MKSSHANGIYTIEANEEEISYLHTIARIAWLESLRAARLAEAAGDMGKAKRMADENLKIFEYMNQLNPGYIEFEQATDINDQKDQ